MGFRASTKDCETAFMPLHDSQANDDRDPVGTVREDRAERSGVVPTLGWKRVSAGLDIHKAF